MTNKEIFEGNKLIALFMVHNWECSKNNALEVSYNVKCQSGIVYPRVVGNWISYNNMEYHSSWDWLMPVVEKIEKLGYEVTIIKKNCAIKIVVESKTIKGTYHACNCFFDTKIEATWNSCIEFIKWYNQRKLADKVFKKRTYRSRKKCIYYLIKHIGFYKCSNSKRSEFTCAGVNCGYYTEKPLPKNKVNYETN